MVLVGCCCSLVPNAGKQAHEQGCCREWQQYDDGHLLFRLLTNIRGGEENIVAYHPGELQSAQHNGGDFCPYLWQPKEQEHDHRKRQGYQSGLAKVGAFC